MTMKIKNLLLASHGTPGGRVAEQAALDLCSAQSQFAAQPAALHHLVVAPDFWKGMMGDDWLNNAVTQIRFGNYVENQIAKEVAVEVERVATAAEAAGIAYSTELVLGKPADCLVATAQRGPKGGGPEGGGVYDLVVIGSPRPRGVPGLRSRMALETLVRGLGAPLMIVPHPGSGQ